MKLSISVLKLSVMDFTSKQLFIHPWSMVKKSKYFFLFNLSEDGFPKSSLHGCYFKQMKWITTFILVYFTLLKSDHIHIQVLRYNWRLQILFKHTFLKIFIELKNAIKYHWILKCLYLFNIIRQMDGMISSAGTRLIVWDI